MAASAKASVSRPRPDLPPPDGCPPRCAHGIFPSSLRLARPTSSFSMDGAATPRLPPALCRGRLTAPPLVPPRPLSLPARPPTRGTHHAQPRAGELTPAGASVAHGDGGGCVPPLPSPGNTFHKAPGEVGGLSHTGSHRAQLARTGFSLLSPGIAFQVKREAQRCFGGPQTNTRSQKDAHTPGPRDGALEGGRSCSAGNRDTLRGVGGEGLAPGISQKATEGPIYSSLTRAALTPTASKASRACAL